MKTPERVFSTIAEVEAMSESDYLRMLRTNRLQTTGRSYGKWAKVFVYCPECSEPLTEDEADQVCDEGCPCCRTIFEVCDYVEQ